MAGLQDIMSYGSTAKYNGITNNIGYLFTHIHLAIAGMNEMENISS